MPYLLKSFQYTFLVAITTLFSSSSYGEKETCKQIIYQAKEIVTMEPGWPSAKFVLVKGDTIRATANTLAELDYYQVPNQCLDKTFEHKVIVPGFIEAHSHMLLGGLTANLPKIYPNAITHADGSVFSGVASPQQAVELIKYYVKNFNNPDKTLIIWGWDVLMMGGLHLDKYILNQVSTTQPILVWDSSEHYFYANDAAMKKAKITMKDSSIQGVISIKGELTGQFIGPKAAVRILSGEIKTMLSADFALPRMQSVLELSAKNGITTTSEMALGIFHLATEEHLYQQLMKGSPLTRVVVTTLAPSLLTAHPKQKAITWLAKKQNNSDDYLIYHGIKFLFDDSYTGLSMMEDDYLDQRKGMYVVQPGDDILSALRPWWQNDFSIHIHSNGSQANHELTNTLELLQRETPRFTPEFIIEHVGFIKPRTINRISKLGAMASVNPYYIYYRSDVNEQYLGADRSAKTAPLKTMFNSGMTVSLHSDSPIGPPVPLEWMWIATNRKSLSGKIKAPFEQVDNATALKMITLNAAKTLGIEDKVGSIEKGKWADFTILDKNPLTTPKEQLRYINVWGTVVGGNVRKVTDIETNMSLITARMQVDLAEVEVSSATKTLWKNWQLSAKVRQAGFSL